MTRINQYKRREQYVEWEALKGNACGDIQRRGQGLQEHDGFEDIAVFLQLFTNTNKSFALINDDILQCFSAWSKSDDDK